MVEMLVPAMERTRCSDPVAVARSLEGLRWGTAPLSAALDLA